MNIQQAQMGVDARERLVGTAHHRGMQPGYAQESDTEQKEAKRVGQRQPVGAPVGSVARLSAEEDEETDSGVNQDQPVLQRVSESHEKGRLHSNQRRPIFRSGGEINGQQKSQPL